MESLRRKLNARNGAVVGTVVGLVAVTVGYFIDSELQDIVNKNNIYETVSQSGLAILVGATIPPLNNRLY